MEEAFQLSTEVRKGFEHTGIWKKNFPGEKSPYEENPMARNGQEH